VITAQDTLAKLSGLSHATVNQVENGTINDLSLTRASKLLEVLGLFISVAAPRPRHLKNMDAKSSALDLAARTAGVSYRLAMSAINL
jgi:transcriptional regulator with XRE-family HTH domain